MKKLLLTITLLLSVSTYADTPTPGEMNVLAGVANRASINIRLGNEDESRELCNYLTGGFNKYSKEDIQAYED